MQAILAISGIRKRLAYKCERGAKSAARCVETVKRDLVLGRPGNDLLSRVLRHSTIGAEEFNGRVRDGIGFFSSSLKSPDRRRTRDTGSHEPAGKSQQSEDPRTRSKDPTFRSFSHHDPRTRTIRAIKPIEPLVPVSSTRHRAYTPGLSTWSSSTALKGELVSRWVSRLDAFSGYPVRT